MSKYTKQVIRETCLELLETKTINKITIKDIVTKCSINRNTFYYYYSDIYEVVEDIFETEKEKVRSKQDSQVSFLSAYRDAADIFLKYKKAVTHLYYSNSRDILYRYFEDVVKNFVLRFVNRKIEGTFLTKGDIKFIVNFYSASITNNSMEWIKNGLREEGAELLQRTADAFDSTIDILIENCKTKNYEKN